MTDTQIPIPATTQRATPSFIGCNGCSTQWTGLTACHCASCHRTFTGIRGLDIHRIGGQCNNPATLTDKKGQPRLIPVNRQHWSGWAEPAEDTRWESA